MIKNNYNNYEETVIFLLMALFACVGDIQTSVLD